MKYLFAIIFCLLFYYSNGQDSLLNIFPFIDGRVTYTAIEKIDSASKTKLYENAKIWFSLVNIKDDAILYNDSTEGTIFGSTSTIQSYIGNLGKKKNVRIDFLVKIYTKDNKFKYKFTKFDLTLLEEDNHEVLDPSKKAPLENWIKLNHGARAEFKNHVLWVDTSRRPSSEFYNNIDNYIRNLIVTLKSTMLRQR